MQNENKRSQPRAKCKWQARVINSEKQIQKATCVNISEEGCCVAVPTKYSNGEKVMIEVAASFYTERVKFKMLGQVAYSTFHASSGMHHCGIDFITEFDDNREFIMRYVASQLR